MHFWVLCKSLSPNERYNRNPLVPTKHTFVCHFVIMASENLCGPEMPSCTNETRGVPSYKALKMENHMLQLREKRAIEDLEMKHTAEMESLRVHSNHNGSLASRLAIEIQTLKEENKHMELVIDAFEREAKEFQKMNGESISKKNYLVGMKKLKKKLGRMYKQEREDMYEIDQLKMENNHMYARTAELTDDRNMLRDIVVDLRMVISRQHEELEMWQTCYEDSLNYDE